MPPEHNTGLTWDLLCLRAQVRNAHMLVYFLLLDSSFVRCRGWKRRFPGDMQYSVQWPVWDVWGSIHRYFCTFIHKLLDYIYPNILGNLEEFTAKIFLNFAYPRDFALVTGIIYVSISENPFYLFSMLHHHPIESHHPVSDMPQMQWVGTPSLTRSDHH